MSSRSSPMDYKAESWRRTLLLSFQSLGVVYGRLSTAPLYVLATVKPEEMRCKEALYGLFSFMFWTMTFIPLVKYAFIVLRADDDGEGGTFALYSLLCRNAKVGLLPHQGPEDEMMNCEMGSTKTKIKSRAKRAIEKNTSSHYLMLFVALFGACMVIGEGLLTPALSVLSASKELEKSLEDLTDQVFHWKTDQKSVLKDIIKHVPVPTACAILIGLFALQHYGTHKLGFLFAPIIILWLLFISCVGLYNIVHCDPHIIKALSPEYMYKFVRHVDFKCWKSLASVLLSIAGTEAMFADLGHFSRRSIKVSFMSFVYPALLLSYAGQTAFLSKNGFTVDQVTYLGHSVPKHVRPLFVVLSLLATAAGSQATITAAFSIINQCQALKCFPRVKVIHTSDKIHGQVYIPDINWLLMVLNLAITIGLRDIRLIASAAGVAIIAGMMVTTCLMSLVFALCWEKKIFVSASFLLFFGIIEAMYLSACILRFHKAAWSLIVLLAICLTCMLAWHYGTVKKYKFEEENKVPLDWFTDFIPYLGVARVPGIGFIYTDIITGIPAFFSHFVTNLPSFHQILIFVSFKPLPVPHVTPSRQYLIGRIGFKDYRVYRCVVRYGYRDNIRDTNDFEDQLIQTIADFISKEGNSTELLTSTEGNMTILGYPASEQHTLIPQHETDINVVSPCAAQDESPSIQRECQPENSRPIVVRRKVRFQLTQDRTSLPQSVREELQELLDARESGTAYFLGQSHLLARNGSNFLKKFLIMVYVLLDKSCRESEVALNIPHAALVEVGMVYNL